MQLSGTCDALTHLSNDQFYLYIIYMKSGESFQYSAIKRALAQMNSQKFYLQL